MDVSICTKNHKMAIMNIFKLEKIIKMNEKIWNLSREMETIKKNQMEVPEWEIQYSSMENITE